MTGGVLKDNLNSCRTLNYCFIGSYLGFMSHVLGESPKTLKFWPKDVVTQDDSLCKIVILPNWICEIYLSEYKGYMV